MMTQYSRAFKSGDEVHINRLYHMVTGIMRSPGEYAWEWLKTWKGPGSIWFVFDDSRKADDQLIAQYSLIPIPFSFWGKPYLAGKTENCMSHPDFRGKGLYFFHEKEYFEVAKEQFQLFFTTAGDVAKGAPGKVRMKLGYKAFDYWVTLSYWLDKTELLNEIDTKLPAIIKSRAWLGNSIKSILGNLIYWYTRTGIDISNTDIKIHSEANAPLQQIEKLWQDNAELYGISVDRSVEYMKWRINDNPYVTHHYLCYYDGGVLKGYVIYTIQDKTIHIVDILAGNKEELIFKIMLEGLKTEGRKLALSQIKCYTASQNQFLVEVLGSSKLINYTGLFSRKNAPKNKPATQIFVYISDELKADHDVWDNNSWYITDLIKEGRPYTARPIE